MLSQTIVIFSDIAKLHISFLLSVIPHIIHVGFLVLLLPVSCDCISINWVLWAKFVRHFLRRLILIRLLWLFSKSSHIRNPRLLLYWILSCCGCLSVSRRLTFWRGRSPLLPLSRLFWLLLLWLFIFWWHWIQHSGRFKLFLIFSKSSYIDSLSFVFI